MDKMVMIIQLMIKKRRYKDKNKKQNEKNYKEEENIKGVTLNANAKKRKKKFCIF